MTVKESPQRPGTLWPDRERMMQVSQSSHIIYEQPLSERIRTFLRLEFLFNRARYLLEHESRGPAA